MTPSSSHTRVIGEVKLGPTTWTVESHCGVVRIISSRDDCMVAINAYEACRVADDLGSMLYEAAESVERAQRGEPR